MPIGLMNLLKAVGRGTGFLRQTPRPAGTPPGWFQRTFDPRKNEPVISSGRSLTTPSARTGGPQGPVVAPGRRGTFYGDGPYARGFRMGGTVLGTLTGSDLAYKGIKSMMKDEEKQAPQQAPARFFPGASGLTAIGSGESREAWEARRRKKLNNDMYRLLQYYGIVNLVNPSQADKMLEIGTALVQQDIDNFGSERQAKIFDAVFRSGALPPNAAAALQRTLDAGGSIDDAKEIAGIYADLTPSSSDLAKDERAMALMTQVDSLISAGLDKQAQQLIVNAIYADVIERLTDNAGNAISPEEQAEMIVRTRGGASSSKEGGISVEAID